MQEAEGYEQEKVGKSLELKIEMIRFTLLPVCVRESRNSVSGSWGHSFICKVSKENFSPARWIEYRGFTGRIEAEMLERVDCRRGKMKRG